MGINHVDFVKIDVETFEPYVLMGLRCTLETSRPIVFFELSWQRTVMLGKKTVKQLFPIGYTIYRFSGHKPIFRIFNRPGYDLQKCSENMFNISLEENYLAVPDESVKLIAKWIAKI